MRDVYVVPILSSVFDLLACVVAAKETWTTFSNYRQDGGRAETVPTPP